MKQVMSKILRDRHLYGFWKKLNFLSLYGMNYGVSSGYADYSGELYIMQFLKNKIPQDGVIFDVGANIGDWSKFLISEYYGLEYKLFMFEPAKNTFQKLKENISDGENRFFYDIGLGDKNEILKIYYDNQLQGSASILNSNSNFSEEIQIRTIDFFCAENGVDKISFIKMDIQGYEYNALIGAKQMILNGKIDFIQFEFDEPNIQNRIFFKDFWELLSSDYDIYRSLYNGLEKIEKYTYELENFMCSNYLAVKKGN